MLKTRLSKTALILCSFAALALTACTTPYQPQGELGGYTNVQYDEMTWHVTFKGNGYTSKDQAIEMTMLRSAELTLEQGYNYFAIIDQDAQDHIASTSSDTYTTGAASRGLFVANSTTYNKVVTKPSADQTIIMFKEKPKNAQVYNASLLCNSLGKKYDVTCPAPAK